MTLAELLLSLFPPSSAKKLTPKQAAILQHSAGPAWVMAGPGSGKTEVLAIFVLRLLYVENDTMQGERVPPESIFIATFTEKAARNLEDRINGYRSRIVSAYPDLASIDISKLRIGTLHGLCNDLLQEHRSPNYQNVRLMDDFEQALFVREHMSLVNAATAPAKISFWKNFPWLFTPLQWQPTRKYPPSRWNGSHALVKLLNRLVEDRVSLASLRAAGGHLRVLADLQDEYAGHLQNTYRCDFSRLQSKFLDFLDSSLGHTFLTGESTGQNAGVRWVLVDEYQDTNPIQEAIYFKLATLPPHNLVVVGDDDQAMYRFRGGSVECMVTFDDACSVYLQVAATSVARFDLTDNFRSHADIVAFFNEYIHSFPIMARPGVRSPKPLITACRQIPYQYPAVSTLAAKTLLSVADRFAQTVRELVDSNIVNDPNECCLLLKSTRESPHNAGPYVAALRGYGFDVYNPRNKAFAEQEEVRCLLGTLISIFDPSGAYARNPANSNVIPSAEPEIRTAYEDIAQRSPQLALYVSGATRAINSTPAAALDASLQDVAYYVLGLEPFASWLDDPARRVRLGKLTKLLESYNSMPVLNPATGLPRANVTRGFLKSAPSGGGLLHAWLGSFYMLFLGYVLEAGFDDEEDDDVICPIGRVPVMTMHQSKGLEFPFVFVGHMSESPKVSASHELETLFGGFPANPARTFTRALASERAEMDMIRQYYVAYSRAKYALVLLGTHNQFKKQNVPLGPQANWVRHRTIPL